MTGLLRKVPNTDSQVSVSAIYEDNGCTVKIIELWGNDTEAKARVEELELIYTQSEFQIHKIRVN